MIGNFAEVLNFNQLFLKLNRFLCNYSSVRFSPFIGINKKNLALVLLGLAMQWTYAVTSKAPSMFQVKQNEKLWG